MSVEPWRMAKSAPEEVTWATNPDRDRSSVAAKSDAFISLRVVGLRPAARRPGAAGPSPAGATWEGKAGTEWAASRADGFAGSIGFNGLSCDTRHEEVGLGAFLGLSTPGPRKGEPGGGADRGRFSYYGRTHAYMTTFAVQH
jgi:hypothetical protein